MANLSLAWGGYYTPILDANQPFDAIELQARVFDLDSLHLEVSQDSYEQPNELVDELRRSGWSWRRPGEYGPFAAALGEGFHTGVLPTSAVAVEQPSLYVPTWADDDPLGGLYAALFGTSEEGDANRWEPQGSHQVGIGALLALPDLTVNEVGLIQASRVGLSAQPHYDTDWINGLYVVRPDDPQDLVAFWNLRSFGRPVIAVPSEGDAELLQFLTRGSVPGGTSMYFGPERRTERYLGVWQLENASPATRAAIDAMAARLDMVVREHRLETSRHNRFPGVDSRFKSSVRAEFPPSAGHVMMAAPSVIELWPRSMCPRLQEALGNTRGVGVEAVENLSPLYVGGKVFEFGVTDVTEAVGDGALGPSELHTGTGRPSLQPLNLALTAGLRQRQTDLHPPPHSAVKQLGVVGRRDDDDVAGEPVDLQQERTHDPLDFASLVCVASLLGNSIELVEEQDAGSDTDGGEQSVEPAGGLAEERTN